MKKLSAAVLIAFATLLLSCGQNNTDAGNKTDKSTDMLGDTTLKDTAANLNDTVGAYTTDSARRQQ